jgi:hypothetical protein
MQHVHVKRKESQMNRYIMDEYHRIPDLHARLNLAAHRERSRAVAAGFKWLAIYAREHLLPRFHFGRSHWLERLG